MCVRLSIYLGPRKQKEKIIIQKVFYGHRLTQINADRTHKLLINFIFGVIIYVKSYLTEHLWDNLEFTTDPSKIEHADFVIVAVPTQHQ